MKKKVLYLRVVLLEWRSFGPIKVPKELARVVYIDDSKKLQDFFAYINDYAKKQGLGMYAKR